MFSYEFLVLTHMSTNQYQFLQWIDINKIDMCYISMNPKAIHFLEKHQEKINWDNLCKYNKYAFHIIKNNLDKVDWETLSGNINAIHILENNLDKVVWKPLSGNINAIHILKNNLDNVVWKELSRNYCIYEIVS
jgi:hypothetical protein